MLSAIADQASLADNSLAAVSASATEPVSLGISTSATSGNVASASGNVQVYRPGRNLDFQGYHSISTTSTIRFWQCLTSNGAATQGASATPAGNYACFRYDTSVPDTHYQCITNNNTTPTVTDSGIAADTAGHRFEMQELSASSKWLFFIDGALVCTMTATLPPSTGNLGYVTSVTTLTTSAETLNFGWNYIESDK